MKTITTPLKKQDLAGLKAGDEILLNGIIYTARDRVHQRLIEAIKKTKKLPINLDGQVIYFCGPTKAAPGRIIGSCGPTTSRRMDEFSPVLLKYGLKGMIGKGNRSKEVAAAVKKQKGVYFLAYAGCAALITRYIKSAKVVMYPDLGPEAVMKLKVENFPLIVAIDSTGKNIYKYE